jgi:uncharacterized protein YjdB
VPGGLDGVSHRFRYRSLGTGRALTPVDVLARSSFMSHARSLLLSLPVVLASLASAGCKDAVASVEITPAKVSLKSDTQTQQLTATPKNAKDEAITDEHAVTWTSADPAVATVDAAGVVKPAGSGKTTVTAKIEEASATATVDVLLLKAIRLPSIAAVVVVGTPTEPFAVVFTNEKGEPVTPEGDAGKVTFTTADAAVATVGPTGIVTGVAAGTTKLTAQAGDLKAEMTITVNPAPEGAAPTGEPAKDGATPPAPPAPGK